MELLAADFRAELPPPKASGAGRVCARAAAATVGEAAAAALAAAAKTPAQLASEAAYVGLLRPLRPAPFLVFFSCHLSSAAAAALGLPFFSLPLALRLTHLAISASRASPHALPSRRGRGRSRARRFVDLLAAQCNPLASLAILPELPALEDATFKQRHRLALEGALRLLPASRR